MIANRRQDIIDEIANLEQVLHFQQKKLQKHEQYFITLFRNPYLVQCAILIPAFLLGLQIGKEKNPSRVIWFSTKLLLYIIQAVAPKIRDRVR